MTCRVMYRPFAKGRRSNEMFVFGSNAKEIKAKVELWNPLGKVIAVWQM